MLQGSRMGLGSLPEYETVIAAFEKKEEARNLAIHNHDCWRWIHGGLGLVRGWPIKVDPVQDYWRRAERRVVVAYLADRFQERYAPAVALRKLAVEIFRHFDLAREAGSLGEPQLVGVPGVWPDVSSKLLRIAKDLPESEEYASLRRVWGGRALAAKTC